VYFYFSEKMIDHTLLGAADGLTPTIKFFWLYPLIAFTLIYLRIETSSLNPS
jgi:hypothetical protein